ncbi:MAG: cation:proton antiporter [Peptococcaceae bacterium]|jgi:CPA2 family monovalent cation:H+ antiporter-2|nr:cation:proton antiporter [Peptococcaceae bacterium]
MEYNFLEIGAFLIFMALCGFIASRLNFSIVPLLIAVGLLLPPNGLIAYTPSESALEVIHLFGNIGVLFLLFSMGLEFSIKKLIESARTMIKSGVIYMIINVALSLIFALFLGWNTAEILIAIGIMVISSSAIVAKTLVDLKRTANKETEVILGLMLFQDIFVAMYLPIVSAVAFSHGGHISELAVSVGAAFLFIAAFIWISLKTNKWLDKVFNIASDETFFLAIVAILITIAGVADHLQVEEATGALILGLVLAETSHHERILRLIVPFRDFFGAAFFFSFGLSIIPTDLSGAVGAALTATAITIAGSLIYGAVMGRTAQISRRGAVNIGLTITSRGEFSIILANLGATAGLSPTLKSFSILYVFLLAVLGPLLSKESENIYNRLAGALNWKEPSGRGKSRGIIDPALLKRDKGPES